MWHRQTGICIGPRSEERPHRDSKGVEGEGNGGIELSISATLGDLEGHLKVISV